jgi:hypothetical protein
MVEQKNVKTKEKLKLRHQKSVELENRVNNINAKEFILLLWLSIYQQKIKIHYGMLYKRTPI